MSDPASSSADRFEQNLAAYLKGVIDAAQINSQVLVTNEFCERTAPVIVQIDAHTDLADAQMGLMQTAGLRIMVSGQVNSVPEKSHKKIVARIWESLFVDPKELRLLWVKPCALMALNRTVGLPDNRPGTPSHVWDLRSPSSSLAQGDQTASTWIVCQADFSPGDWDGAQPYGQ